MNGHTKQDLLTRLEDHFIIKEKSNSPQLEELRTFGMYLDRSWYELTLKREPQDKSAIHNLDAKILTDKVLDPVFGIHDLKTDERISFIDGTQGMEGIEKAVDSGKYAVGFALCPVTFEQLKDVADSGAIMPPKTTWIEPKLRSGITIYELF
jgi:uncharacterized protein (DUF1015 family)